MNSTRLLHITNMKIHNKPNIKHRAKKTTYKEENIGVAAWR